MDEQLTLIALIEKRPTERVPKKLLADWMMEHHCLAPFAALRFSAKFARAVRTTREMKQAAALIQHSSPASWWLFEEIYGSIGRSYEDTLEVYLVTGSRPPQATLILDQQLEGEPLVFCVLVGARWLIRRAEQLQFAPSKREMFDTLKFQKLL